MVDYFVADLNDFEWYRPRPDVSSLRIERVDENGSILVQVTECDPNYLEYLEWLKQGNVPKSWTPPMGDTTQPLNLDK